MQDNTTPSTINFSELVQLNEESLKESGMKNFTPAENETEKVEQIISEVEIPEVIEPKVEEEAQSADITTDNKPELVTETPKPVEEKPKSHFGTLAKTLLKQGTWKDVIIEGEDGEEVKLSEMENLDEETFLSINSEQNRISKEEIDENFIPTKGMDENRKRIISIISNGGDIKEIFQTEAQMKTPYEGLDLEDLQTQQNVLYSYYIVSRGLDKDEATNLVVNATKDMSVDSKSKQIVNKAQEDFGENLKKIEANVKQQKIEEQNSIKEYKKSLSTHFKQDGIEDKLTKTFIEAATQKTPEGELYIDSVYEKIMKDPAQAKDLIFYMLEKEKFLTKLGANVKRETNIGNLRKIKLVQETAKTSNAVKEEEEIKSQSIFSNIIIPE